MTSPLRPARILFLGPDGVAHVTRWVRFLRERGHEVVLASAHRIDHDEPCGGLPLVPEPGTRPLGPGAILTAARTARGLARDLRPHVTVSYYLTSYGVIGCLAGLRPHVCATAGGDVLVDRFDTLRRRVINRAALALVRRRTDRLLAWAPHVADALIARGVDRSRIFVQPRGVLLDLFPFRPPRERAPGEPLRILSNRMLKPLYGLDVLLRALAVLEDRGVPFEARVCGDGSERQPLQELARSLGIAARTTFAGTVPAGRMADELSWTDVYVSTSFTDGASSSLFEAMAVGRFPVVSDLPANRPFVEQGVSGVLFPPGDSAALAAALEKAAGDPGLCRSGGLRAREIAAAKLDYRCNMTAIESAILESRVPETTLPS